MKRRIISTVVVRFFDVEKSLNSGIDLPDHHRRFRSVVQTKANVSTDIQASKHFTGPIRKANVYNI